VVDKEKVEDSRVGVLERVEVEELVHVGGAEGELLEMPLGQLGHALGAGREESFDLHLFSLFLCQARSSSSDLLHHFHSFAVRSFRCFVCVSCLWRKREREREEEEEDTLLK